MEQYPNTGQNPYGQPQPGNQGQYPNTGQNPYGQPGSQGQYPNTGQNPYGPPPQQGYPGTTPFGQPATGYGAPPTLAPTPAPRRNNRAVPTIAAVVIVLLLIIGGIIHVNSATSTVKGFYDDLFSFNYSSAFSRVCSDKQSAIKAEFDATTSTLNQAKGQATFDSSKIVYSLKSGGLTSAVVTISGNLVTTVSGTANTTPIPATDISLNASGLGWCLNVLPDTTGSSSS